ncbi:hypothetical protein F0562_005405 [Nyssa sinensis]|uniref:Uncharacterized protein n=1 Tax=Nyssa sinensis TaxID=561372 RepID=A0A5J5ANL1_9ASTE|nr:hypothetical protein F0562_005405 [Nyssa sinensis]
MFEVMEEVSMNLLLSCKGHGLMVDMYSSLESKCSAPWIFYCPYYEVCSTHLWRPTSTISASYASSGGLALSSLEACLCNLWRHVFATSGGASSGELWRLGSVISGGTSLPPLEACLCHLLRRKL